MIEIKGKDGSVIQLEVNYNIGEEYTFYYKNNNIFFTCKDYDGYGNGPLLSFVFDLEELLENNPNSNITEKLCQEPDSWLRKQLKKISPSFFTKLPETVSKNMQNNSCLFEFLYPDATLECKRIKDSSDYIIEFEFVDPNFVQDIDEGSLILKGSFLVTEEALLNFYRSLVSY